MDIKDVYKDVQILVPDIEKIMISLTKCVNHLKHEFAFGNGRINMRAINEIGLINYHDYKSELTYSIGTYGVDSTHIVLAQSLNDNSIWYIQSRKILGTDDYIMTDEFLDLSKDEYFNYLLGTSEINLKYIIGCAIILKKWVHNVDNVITLDAERIDSLGLHSLATELDKQTKRIINENIFSEDI